MSFTFRTIPLDCLALTCQYLTEMRDHCAIHSTSRHWRRILISSDRYSHSSSSVAALVNIKWQGKASGLDCDETNRLQERRQRLDLEMLTGIHLAFIHLRTLSITFNITSGTKKMQKQTDKLRSSFYPLLGSFVAIQHLSIIDLSSPIESSSADLTYDEKQFLFFHDDLARALAHITTLQTFHYDIKWVSTLIEKTASSDLPTISNALVIALTKSTRINAISGDSFIQTMSEDQWVILLSSLSHLKRLGGVDLPTFRRLHSIARSKSTSNSSDSSDSTVNLLRVTARTQIRSSLEHIESVCDIHDRRWEIAWKPLSETMKSRFLLLPNSTYWDWMKRFKLAIFELHRQPDKDKEKIEAHKLRQLTIDWNQFERQNELKLLSGTLGRIGEMTIESCQREEEIWYYRLPSAIIPSSFISLLPSLRCLILTHHLLYMSNLSEILTAATRLLELRLNHTRFYREVVVFDKAKQIVTRKLTQIIESSKSLHLLKMENVTLSSYSNSYETYWKADTTLITSVSQRCAKMLGYADRISWTDLVTLSRDDIKKRIAGEPPTSV